HTVKLRRIKRRQRRGKKKRQQRKAPQHQQHPDRKKKKPPGVPPGRHCRAAGRPRRPSKKGARWTPYPRPPPRYGKTRLVTAVANASGTIASAIVSSKAATRTASRSGTAWDSHETSASTSRVTRWRCTTKANRWRRFSGRLTASTCASIANGRRPQ